MRTAFLIGAVVAVLVSGCQQPASSASASASAAAPAAPVASAPAAPPPVSDWVMTADGYGPVRTGMTQAQALAALGAGWSLQEGSNESCRFISTGDDGAAIQQFMVRNGVVAGARADDYAPTAGRSTVKTDRGVGLGSTAAQVRAAYPQGLEATPASITDMREFLRVAAANGRGVQFLTNDEDVVVSMAAGDPAVFSVDGCG